jgi:hypothetical protein
MHSLKVHYTIAASRQLQLGVELITKCGGISFISHCLTVMKQVVNIITVDMAA